MDIRFNCPCGKSFKVSATSAGKRGRCSSCGSNLVIPSFVPTVPPVHIPNPLFMNCRTCGQQLASQAVACVGCGCPPLVGNRFCQTCGANTNPSAILCVKCGVALKDFAGIAGGVGASLPPRDPVLMGVLSGCCICGLGQIVLGQTIKGFAILLMGVLISVGTAGLGILVIWPLGAIDAYLIAKKLKAGKMVGRWEFF